MKKYSIPVKGMTCASCVARVEKVAGKFEGLKNISVNLATEKLNFETDNNNINLQEIAQSINEYGYELDISSLQNKNDKSETKDETKDYSDIKKDFQISLFFTIPIFF